MSESLAELARIKRDRERPRYPLASFLGENPEMQERVKLLAIDDLGRHEKGCCPGDVIEHTFSVILEQELR